MAGPSPFEMAKMNGGSVLDGGEFAVKQIGGNLVGHRPGRRRSAWGLVVQIGLTVVAVAALVAVVVMPMILD